MRPDTIDPSENGDDVVSDTRSAEQLPKPLPNIDTLEGIHEVLERAEKGEAAMRPLVRQLLERDGGAALLTYYADVFSHARNELVKIAAGKNIAVQLTLAQKIDSIRDELAGPSATALERILCERVALCWFDAYEMDRRYVNVESDITFKNAEYRESRRDRAHKRFLAACKTLATVRKLGVPVVQVNVARRQVNIAGGAS
jgi:hypothetical protein